MFSFQLNKSSGFSAFDSDIYLTGPVPFAAAFQAAAAASAAAARNKFLTIPGRGPKQTTNPHVPRQPSDDRAQWRTRGSVRYETLWSLLVTVRVDCHVTRAARVRRKMCKAAVLRDRRRPRKFGRGNFDHGRLPGQAAETAFSAAGKGRRDRHQHSILCERPSTSRPRAGSRDEPPTGSRDGPGHGPGP